MLPTPTGAEAVFGHVDDDDIDWQEVRRQRNADGTVSSIREKWLAFGTEPLYLSLVARWDPGMIVRRHGHNAPHVVYVLAGELWCEDRRLTAGAHIELPMGAAFGPFRAGPDGCELFEVMMGDPRSWGDRPETYRQLCATHGVEPLPDPPVALPPHLEDLRQLWADEQPSGDQGTVVSGVTVIGGDEKPPENGPPTTDPSSNAP